MLRRLAWTFVALSAACSGPSFSSDDCGDATCAGQSSGGTSGASGTSTGGANGAGEGGEATGGATTGGATTGGSDTGGSGAGGSGTGGATTGGTAGTDTGGTSGSAGTNGTDFPRYGVLDDFNREGADFGSDWLGARDPYTLESNAMHCTEGFCPGFFWREQFGPTQEVFATLVSFSSQSPELNLVLKGQADTQGQLNTTCDLLELIYSPALQRLSVEACWDGSWVSFGFVEIAFEPGDQLGGRIGADSFVDLFRNGVRIGRFDASDFPFIDASGHIGVDGIVADGGEPHVWDDFGGGGE